MPKRSPSVATTTLKSRSGRVVWDDGTLATVPATLAIDGRSSAAHPLGGESLLTGSGPGDSDHSLHDDDASPGSRVLDPGEEGGSSPRAGHSSTPRAGPPRVLGGGEGGGIFKQAAVEVLRAEKRLMSTGEIARLALSRGLVRCSGKTPEATMASALYTDIKRHEGRSVFIRPHEGMFGLREWVELGIAFRDDHAEELARRVRASYGPYAVPLAGAVQSLPLAYPPGYPYALPASWAPASPGTAAPGPALDPGAAHAEVGASGLMELLTAAEELKRSSSPEPRGEGAWGGGTPADPGNALPDAAWGRAPGTLHRLPSAAASWVPGPPREAAEQQHAHAADPAPSPPHDAMRAAEAQVMRLEGELGPRHPAVGRAYVDLARLYTASCASGTVRQLAEAALVRASEIMTACQEALQRAPACGDAFAYLLRPRASGPASPGAAEPAQEVDAAVVKGELDEAGLPAEVENRSPAVISKAGAEDGEAAGLAAAAAIETPETQALGTQTCIQMS